MATTLIAKIAARAKVIRKSNPKMTWQSALKKAGAELKGSGAKTTSKRRVGVVARTKKGKTVKRKIGSTLLPEHKKYFKQISLAQAKKRFNNNQSVYGLRDDETEFLIEDLKDFQDRSIYAFGYEIGRVNGKTKRKIGSSKDAKNWIVVFDSGFKSYSLKGKDDDGNFWYYGKYKTKAAAQKMADKKNGLSKKKTTKRVSGSTHKDNKSHNVSIRVVSGTKRVKTVRPKIQKTNIDLEKLNGILKIQTGKYFEVESGNLKKSAFYIKSTSKATKDKPKTYNVKFWQFRSGRLSKPFDATITDAWINKRSIRPRGVVKSTEYIAFAK